MNTNEKAYWDAVSTVIRMELTAIGLTQADMAEKVGVSRDAMGNYLRGKRDMPFGVLVKVAESLGLTPHKLFGLAEDRLKQGR